MNTKIRGGKNIKLEMYVIYYNMHSTTTVQLPICLSLCERSLFSNFKKNYL